MARTARGLPSLLRRALQQTTAEGEALAVQQRFASSAPSSAPKVNYAESNGKYTLGLFNKEKPVDRSYEWVQKNPYIEAWYYRRDHYEREFVWDYRTTMEAVWFLGGFTVGLYALSEWCFRQSDRRSGYPRRTILGDEPGMVLPDEREFY